MLGLLAGSSDESFFRRVSCSWFLERSFQEKDSSWRKGLEILLAMHLSLNTAHRFSRLEAHTFAHDAIIGSKADVIS